ncbi:uncharacterized protein PSFLO_06956 [Pseudozyma flocculosa]|nr:uncharacterized protein PSFLO_06956 [Pseudozyma flocculosa]
MATSPASASSASTAMTSGGHPVQQGHRHDLASTDPPWQPDRVPRMRPRSPPSHHQPNPHHDSYPHPHNYQPHRQQHGHHDQPHPPQYAHPQQQQQQQHHHHHHHHIVHTDASAASSSPSHASPETAEPRDSNTRYNGFTAMSQHVFWCLGEVCPALRDWDQRQAHIRLRRPPGLARPPLQLTRAAHDHDSLSSPSIHRDLARQRGVSARILATAVCSLFAHFAANIMPVFPVLSDDDAQAEMLAALQAPSLDQMDPDVDIWLKQRSGAPPLSLLALVICAISSLSRSRPLDERRAIVYALRDRLRAGEGLQLLLRTSLRNIQTLLLLSLTPELLSESSTEAHSLLWMYAGAAFRMALDLGFHRHKHLSALSPVISGGDARERAWKCCILVDAFHAAGFGQPPTIASELALEDAASGYGAPFGSFDSIYDIAQVSRLLYITINGGSPDEEHPREAVPDQVVARMQYWNAKANESAHEALETLPPCAVFARLLLLLTEFNLWRYAEEQRHDRRQRPLWGPSLPELMHRADALLHCFQRHHLALLDSHMIGFNAITVATLLAALDCLCAGKIRRSLTEAELCFAAWADAAVTDEPVPHREGRLRDKLLRVMQLVATAVRHELGATDHQPPTTGAASAGAGANGQTTAMTGPDQAAAAHGFSSFSTAFPAFATGVGTGAPGAGDADELPWHLLDETLSIFDQWPQMSDQVTTVHAATPAAAAAVPGGALPANTSPGDEMHLIPRFFH